MKSQIHEHQENNLKIVSKKSIITLGLALVAFANVSFANNEVKTVTFKTEFAKPNTTPLCAAVVKGDLEAVKKFIEYGSDVNESFNGVTPLMYAARYNRIEIIKILLDKGAKVTTQDDRGYTALQYAEFSKSTDAIAVLK